MSKQIGQFFLPNNILSDMKDKIKETKKLNIELGFALCTEKDHNGDHKIIIKGSECTGDKCSMKAGVCKEEYVQIGNYHTHPRSDPTMSITDMVTGCSECIECIGSTTSNGIVCYSRKTDESSCLKDTSPFEEEEHEILEKGSEIRDILSSPRSIMKTGIYNTLKKFKKYEDSIVKYNANRIKLLHKHFDRVRM